MCAQIFETHFPICKHFDLGCSIGPREVCSQFSEKVSLWYRWKSCRMDLLRRVDASGLASFVSSVWYDGRLLAHVLVPFCLGHNLERSSNTHQVDKMDFGREGRIFHHESKCSNQRQVGRSWGKAELAVPEKQEVGSQLVKFPDCHECQSGERTPWERGSRSQHTLGGFLLRKVWHSKFGMLSSCCILLTDFRTVFVFALGPFLPMLVIIFYFNGNFNEKMVNQVITAELHFCSSFQGYLTCHYWTACQIQNFKLFSIRITLI